MIAGFCGSEKCAIIRLTLALMDLGILSFFCHIRGIKEVAKEDSKCSSYIFRPDSPCTEIRGLTSNYYLEKATCGLTLASYVALCA